MAPARDPEALTSSPDTPQHPQTAPASEGAKPGSKDAKGGSDAVPVAEVAKGGYSGSRSGPMVSNTKSTYRYVPRVNEQQFPTTSETSTIAYLLFGPRVNYLLDSWWWSTPWALWFMMLGFCGGAVGFILGLTGVPMFLGSEISLLAIGTIPYNVVWMLLFNAPIVRTVIFSSEWLLLFALNCLTLVGFLFISYGDTSRMVASVLFFFNTLLNITSDARPFVSHHVRSLGNLWGYVYLIFWTAQTLACQMMLVLFYSGLWTINTDFHIGALNVDWVSIGIGAFQSYSLLKLRYLIAMFQNGKDREVTLCLKAKVYYILESEATRR